MISFLFRKFAAERGCSRAMEDEEVEPALKGFRSRWTKASRGGSDGNSEHVASGYSPSLNLEDPIESPDGEFSDIFRRNVPQQSDVESAADFEVIPESRKESTCSQAAAEILTTNAFVRNVSWSSLVLPWENDFMSQIFSDSSVPDPKLSLPSQWNAAVVTASPSKPDVSVPSVPVESIFAKHVRQIKEETFWEKREKNSKHAIAKWILFLKSDLTASQVGLQIDSGPDAAEDIVLAVLGVKSPVL